MALTVANLVMQIETKGADKAKADMDGVNKSAGDSAGFFGKAGAGVLGFVAAGAGIGLLKSGYDMVSGAVSSFIDRANESNLVMAQTEAGIKSTHGVAGMTAQAVTDLATKISNLSGIDDEAVQTGENMLLTFTRIGHSVFPAVTQAAADMATKMNGGAIPAAGQLQQNSILLGKALNDPIKGISALTRVGVTFSEEQKKSIATMMKHGDIAGAQAVILKELQTEFGGAAKAAGDTFAGKMAKLNVGLDNMREKIGNAIIPIISKLVDKFSPLITQIADNLPAALQVAGNALQPIINFLGFLADHADETKIVLAAFAIAIGAALVPAFIAWATAAGAAAVTTMLAILPVILVAAQIALLILVIKLLISHWGDIASFFGKFAGAIGNAVGGIMGALGGLLSKIPELLGHLKDLALSLIMAMVNLWLNIYIRWPLQVLGIIAGFIGKFLGFLGELRDKAIAKAVELVEGYIQNMMALPGRLVKIGGDIIGGLLQGLVSNEGKILDWLKGLAGNMISSIKGVFGIASPSKAMHQIGQNLALGLVNGLASGNVAGHVRKHMASVSAHAARHATHTGQHAISQTSATPSGAPGAGSSASAGGTPFVITLDGRALGKGVMPYFMQALQQAGVKIG